MVKPTAFAFDFFCAACGKVATHVELRREGAQWWFLYSGIVAGNGGGDIVSEQAATRYTAAFTNAPQFDLMRDADLHYDNAGFCTKCALAYCFDHWNASTTGYGRCPKGHGASLDPHWSPDW